MKRNTATQGAKAAARIKAWAAGRFGDGDEEAWLVSEEVCRGPADKGVQTILVLVHPAARIAFRLPRPMAEITQDDIAALGAPAAALAAEACC